MLNGKEAIQEAFVKQSLIFADRPQLYLTVLFKNNRGRFNVIQIQHKFNVRFRIFFAVIITIRKKTCSQIIFQLLTISTGIALHPYNEDFKTLHRLSLNILKQFGLGRGIMESRIRIEVENMLSRFRLKDGQAFDPSYETTASVSNVICSIIFGKRCSVDDPEFHEGMNIVHLQVRNLEKVEMVNLFPILRFFPVFRRAIKYHMKLRERWRSYITSALERIIDVKEEDSFYKILKKELETEAENINKKDIAERLFAVVKDLFFAGTETTATTLLWFTVLMANHEDVQKQIRDEMDQVVGMKRHPSLEDKPNLPLLEATLLELMRFKTLAPFALPHSTLKDTYLNGMFIPANTVVCLGLHEVRHNN